MKSTKTKSISDYIATFPLKTRAVLKRLRAAIKSTAPKATERISYGIPTFDLDGKRFIYFAGWTSHVSIYPVTPGITKVLKGKIALYRGGKGTLKFSLAKPLPMSLIRRIVTARAREMRAS